MRVTLRLWMALVLVTIGAFGVAGLVAPTSTAAPPGEFCGGIAGIPCSEGFVCVDVPGDGCNPNRGGADCAGYCKRGH